jgi:hypothetical protein
MSRTVRSLAAEAGLSVRDCLDRLRAGGLSVAIGRQRLEGGDLARALAVLGLPERPAERPLDSERQALDQAAMLVRLLRPLRQKGKLGREHTTPFEHVYGHGIPDHQKAEARELAERLLAEGCLGAKTSQGRRHVWLTDAGLRRLAEVEPSPDAT